MDKEYVSTMLLPWTRNQWPESVLSRKAGDGRLDMTAVGVEASRLAAHGAARRRKATGYLKDRVNQ